MTEWFHHIELKAFPPESIVSLTTNNRHYQLASIKNESATSDKSPSYIPLQAATEIGFENADT